MQGAGSGTLWKLKRAAPNFTKLVQLERTAKACVRSCAKGAWACGRSCVQLSGRASVACSQRVVRYYLTTFFSWYFEPINRPGRNLVALV
jgi:hypothetical protein